jgi:hypothetical protein
MSLNQLAHGKAGLGATLVILLVLAAALTVIFVALWLQRRPRGEPNPPGQATMPTSQYRVPSSEYGAWHHFPRALPPDEHA